ncbi:MAG: sigma-70 family RNA polymerase sigma factor [Pirellulales bacterium]|nr:sigma-70 family RNA polymerase sigma factor [Pirellulales bacterium]
MPSTLQSLVDACLVGDSTATAAFVARFRGPVFGLCYRILGHREDAEDMAQETLVRALRSLDRWDRDRPFEPWLLAIAGNRCRTLLARRYHRPKMQSDVSELADPRPDVNAAKFLAEEIELALSKVREEYRRAFLLFHERHLSYEQIGQVLDCPLGTVKTWVHRARKEIVSQLHSRGVVHEQRDAVRRT